MEEKLCELIWGEPPEPAVFSQWSQGFVPSEHCTVSLVQEKGGPCSVIVPVQAFLIKNLLFDRGIELAAVTSAEMDAALSSSFATILSQTCPAESLTLVSCNPELPEPSYGDLHTNLQISTLPLDSDLGEYVRHCRGRYGVLCFLYSVVLTRGVERILADLGPMNEGSLIHSKFGHSNQSLLNLMLTGAAVPNVFDGSKDLGGIQLAGIEERSDVGYLTLLEALRYCKVGENLKSPVFPMWVLGSESHTTLLFSPDRAVSTHEESPLKGARAAFDRFDTEGNGFIPTSDLPRLLEHLAMVSDEEYVSFMRDRLDPDTTGIILFPAFLEEFFPGLATEGSLRSRQFSLLHYNGLKQSNFEDRVELRDGSATVFVEYNGPMDASTAPTSLLRVLRTKWPTIEVQWTSTPSID